MQICKALSDLGRALVCAPVPHRHPSLLAAPAPAPGRLWLTGARLFDGTGAPVRDAAAVLVSNGAIERVGAAGEPVPEGARVLDLGGRTIIPGLINIHVHVQGHEPRREHGAEALLAGTSAHFLQSRLRDTLRMGVTTLRNVGSQSLQPQEARQAMRYGAFRGPRLLTCGLIISATAPGGRFYGAMYREADGPDEMRKAVREQLRDGADFVKVMTTGARSNELEDPEPAQMTDAEFAAVVDEAHRMGFKVAAHVEGLDGTSRGDRPRDGHDRARHVPQPAARPARRDGGRRSGAGADAQRLLLDGRTRRRHRPDGGNGRPAHAPQHRRARPPQPRAGHAEHARGARGRSPDRARLRPRGRVGRRHGAGAGADGPPRPQRSRGTALGHGSGRQGDRARRITSAPSRRASSPTSWSSMATSWPTPGCSWTRVGSGSCSSSARRWAGPPWRPPRRPDLAA